MVRLNLSIPHRFLCFTDDPAGVECETYPLWDDPQVPNRNSHHDSYRRLKLFSPWAADEFGPGYILALDLDCLVTGPLDPLVTWQHDVRLLRGAVCTYNGSMWFHRLGTRTHVWDDFDPVESPKITATLKTPRGKPWRGSDQTWLSYKLPDEPMYDDHNGVYRWERYAQQQGRIPDGCRLIFFPGTKEKKPWSREMYKSHRYIHELYHYYHRMRD